MKRTNLILVSLAFSLIVLNGCKKESIDTLSGTSMSEGSTGISLEKKGNGTRGTVYIMDNSPSGNNVLVFNRDGSGLLTAAGSFSTGGTGTGSGLGSQGSIILDDDYLYVCNSGSNEITVFKTGNSGLTLIDRVSSEGIRPVSITTDDDLMYVLNAGGTGNISGFRIMSNHHLYHIPNSDRSLSSSSAGAAQIEFNQNGSQLVVTEKATNNILTYDVYSSGLTATAVVHPSVGNTPFGFEIGKHNEVIVSDAFGGAPGQSALTSYSLSNSGNLNLITGPVATTQTAACWVVITHDGRFCYTTNTGSANVSGYKISSGGALTLLDANGITGTTGFSPIDMSLSKNSKFLYTLNTVGRSISMFSVNNNGGLTSLGEITGLPEKTVGMAAE